MSTPGTYEFAVVRCNGQLLVGPSGQGTGRGVFLPLYCIRNPRPSCSGNLFLRVRDTVGAEYYMYTNLRDLQVLNYSDLDTSWKPMFVRFEEDDVKRLRRVMSWVFGNGLPVKILHFRDAETGYRWRSFLTVADVTDENDVTDNNGVTRVHHVPGGSLALPLEPPRLAAERLSPEHLDLSRIIFLPQERVRRAMEIEEVRGKVREFLDDLVGRYIREPMIKCAVHPSEVQYRHDDDQKEMPEE